MPTYDYKCPHHGYFEARRLMEVRQTAGCPQCGVESKQVIRSAPNLDIGGMAKAGCPGAHEKVGNDMEKRHKAAGQDWSRNYE